MSSDSTLVPTHYLTKVGRSGETHTEFTFLTIWNCTMTWTEVKLADEKGHNSSHTSPLQLHLWKENTMSKCSQVIPSRAFQRGFSAIFGKKWKSHESHSSQVHAGLLWSFQDLAPTETLELVLVGTVCWRLIHVRSTVEEIFWSFDEVAVWLKRSLGEPKALSWEAKEAKRRHLPHHHNGAPRHYHLDEILFLQGPIYVRRRRDGVGKRF